MKQQETLEEAGVAYLKTVNENHTSHMLGFYNGARWQQEQDKKMYSEMQVYQIIELIRLTGESPEFIMEQLNKPIHKN